MKKSEPLGAIDLSQYVQLSYQKYSENQQELKVNSFEYKWVLNLAVLQGLVDVSESWEPFYVEMGPWEFQMLSLLCSFYEGGRQRLFSHWRNQVWFEGGFLELETNGKAQNQMWSKRACTNSTESSVSSD